MKYNLKKDFIWNTIGSICYSAVSILLSTLVVRLVGKEDGGIFAFGFTTLAQQIFCIAYFGSRANHIVDINYKYTFYEYRHYRYMTTILSILCGILYLLVLFLLNKNDLYKTIILFVLIFHGVIEGFFDVYEAEYQRQGYLYIAGKSILFRTLSWTLVFLCILFWTKNLLLSSIAGMITKFIMGYILDTIKSRKYFKEENIEEVDLKTSMLAIFKKVLPLFLIIFLDSFVFMSHKFVLDSIKGDIYSGLYSFLFLPANGIYLLNYLLVRPILTPLSEKYSIDKNDYNNYIKNIVKFTVIIGMIVIVVVNVLSYIYIDLIKIFTNGIYNKMMENSFWHILFATIGGMFYAIYNLFYYIYVIENRTMVLLKIYFVVAIISLVLSIVLINIFGFLGTSIAYMLNMLILMVSVVGNYIIGKKI